MKKTLVLLLFFLCFTVFSQTNERTLILLDIDSNLANRRCRRFSFKNKTSFNV